MRRFPGVLIFLLLLCLTFRAEPSLALDPPAAKKLTIGYIGDLTGIGAFFGVQTEKGIRLAEEEFGKQHPLKILFEDMGGKTATAVSAAMKLLAQDHVDAIICDLTGPCTAVAPQVEAAKKILIYHSPATSIAAAHKQSFRNFIDYTTGCRGMAVYWKEKGFTDIGSLNGNGEFGQRCFEGVEAVFPKHYAYRNNPGDDLRSAVLGFKDKKLRHIVFTGYEPDFLAWLKLTDSQGGVITPGFIELLITESLWKQIGEFPFSGITAGFEDLPSDFQARLEKKFSTTKDVNLQGAALSYNAVRSLVEAFQACPAKELECLISKLREPKSGWLLGFRGFLPGQPEYPVVLKAIEGRKLTPLKN